MNRTVSFRTAVSMALIALFAGTLITAYARADTWPRRQPDDATRLLGARLPALTLRAADGTAVSLADRLSRSHGPSLIIVLGVGDCLGCSSYELELQILRSTFPGISPILIGSGADEKLFGDYFRRAHLEPVALLDRDRVLLDSLRVNREPLVLLVDSTGRILFVDARSSSAATQFPFGRLLPLLGGALQPVSSPTSKSGEPN